MEKVKLIRTMNGEYLLAMVDNDVAIDDISQTNNILHLKDVRKLSIGMSMTGEASVALVPICPFAINKIEEINIDKSQIMFELDEDNIQKEIVTSYRSEISGITLAKSTTSDIII